MSNLEQRLKRLEEALAVGGDWCECDGGRSIVFVDYYAWHDNPDRFGEVCATCGKPKQVTVVVEQVVGHDGRPLSREEVAARQGLDNARKRC